MEKRLDELETQVGELETKIFALEKENAALKARDAILIALLTGAKTEAEVNDEYGEDALSVIGFVNVLKQALYSAATSAIAGKE